VPLPFPVLLINALQLRSTWTTCVDQHVGTIFIFIGNAILYSISFLSARSTVVVYFAVVLVVLLLHSLNLPQLLSSFSATGEKQKRREKKKKSILVWNTFHK